MQQKTINDLDTPSLLLNQNILANNCRQMQQRITSFGISLRPHMKTAKSIDVYRIATQSGFKGITVSTLAEAAYFAANGVKDILYAVGIVPNKVQQVANILSQRCNLKLITDNVAIIDELNKSAQQSNLSLKLLIEIDSGGRRGGVLADSQELINLGKSIAKASNLEFIGVMTHAGHSYHCKSQAEIESIAEEERIAVVTAATRLKNELNMHCQIISTGSTPTATHAKSFKGLTETRPGVYMFGDIDQCFIGSCDPEDVAVSVLTTVIGHNRQAGRILIDAGGLALSKDISASEFSKQTGYGWITDISGKLIDNLYIESVHQEHGMIANAGNGNLNFDEYPVGSKLRALPIHACMTVAAYEHYFVHDRQNNVIDKWSRVNRW